MMRTAAGMHRQGRSAIDNSTAVNFIFFVREFLDTGKLKNTASYAQVKGMLGISVLWSISAPWFNMSYSCVVMNVYTGKIHLFLLTVHLEGFTFYFF